MCNHYNDIKEDMRAFVKKKAGYSRLCGEFKEILEKTTRKAWCSKIQYAPLITVMGYTKLRLYRQGEGIPLPRAFFNMTKNSSFKAATGYSGHRLYRHPFLVHQDPFSPDKTAGARIASVIPDTSVHFLVPPPDIPDTGVIVHISSIHLTNISLTEKHLLE